jgi:parallel beta-helix repeat protein
MKIKNMEKMLVFTTVFLMLSMMSITVKSAISQVQLETIVIRPDGAVSPATAPLQKNGNTYTFTDNLYAAIKIQKSNIVLDGAGYTLWGPYNGEQSDIWFIGTGTDQLPTSTQQYTIGVDLGGTDIESVIVKNLNIKNFSIGMYMWTKNNTIVGNALSGNIIGILLSGSNSTVSKNCIINNQRGLFFGFNNEGDIIPPDIFIDHNSFEGNIIQLNGCECPEYNTTEPPHNWDNGRKGNYWSDYNGTDFNGDGIGDTPYVIDILNQDRYPLMQSTAKQPFPSAKVPLEDIVLGVLAAMVAAIAALVYILKRKKT